MKDERTDMYIYPWNCLYCIVDNAPILKKIIYA